LKYCPNVEKLLLQHPELATPTVSVATPTSSSATASSEPKKLQAFNLPASEQAGFSIKDIKLGERYE